MPWLGRPSCWWRSPADVYRYGLSPNKLFDYLAAGRPVLLASRLDDTPVSEADAGRCYEPGSGPSLAEGIIAALLALPPDERALMGLRGQELVRRRYTIAVTGAQLSPRSSSSSERADDGSRGAVGWRWVHRVGMVDGLGREVTAPSRSEVDLIDKDRLQAFLQPGDLIVNATGYAMATDRSAAGLARFRRDNVEAVRTLATAAWTRSAQHGCCTSAALRRWVTAKARTCGKELAQPRTPYGQSKRDAEDAIVDAAEDAGHDPATHVGLRGGEEWPRSCAGSPVCLSCRFRPVGPP